jgi:hypothetical protein
MNREINTQDQRALEEKNSADPIAGMLREVPGNLPSTPPSHQPTPSLSQDPVFKSGRRCERPDAKTIEHVLNWLGNNPDEIPALFFDHLGETLVIHEAQRAMVDDPEEQQRFKDQNALLYRFLEKWIARLAGSQGYKLVSSQNFYEDLQNALLVKHGEAGKGRIRRAVEVLTGKDQQLFEGLTSQLESMYCQKLEIQREIVDLRAEKERAQLKIQQELLEARQHIAALNLDFLKQTNKNQELQHALLQQIRDDGTREREALAQERLLHSQRIQELQARIEHLQSMAIQSEHDATERIRTLEHKAAQMERDTADRCAEMLAKTKNQLEILEGQVAELQQTKARLEVQVRGPNDSAVHFANLKARALEGTQLAIQQILHHHIHHPPKRSEIITTVLCSESLCNAFCAYLPQLYEVELVFGSDARKDVATAVELSISRISVDNDFDRADYFSALSSLYSLFRDHEAFHALYREMTRFQREEISWGDFARLVWSIGDPRSQTTIVGGGHRVLHIEKSQVAALERAIASGTLKISNVDEMVVLGIYRLSSSFGMHRKPEINLDPLLERGVVNLESLREITFTQLTLENPLHDPTATKAVVDLLVALRTTELKKSVFVETSDSNSSLLREELDRRGLPPDHYFSRDFGIAEGIDRPG